MGPDEILPLIRKSVVRITIAEEVICGIIIACKSRSAYVIADARYYDQNEGVVVEFPDDSMVCPTHDQCYTHHGILGMSCYLDSSSVFDQNMVGAVDICEEDAAQCEKVYVYEDMFGTITEGHAIRKVDAEHYKITNLAGLHSEYGAPVVKEDGRLVGFCCSFKHSLTAKNIASVVFSIGTSHDRDFMNLADTLTYLHTII